jgi:hypothetical protein
MDEQSIRILAGLQNLETNGSLLNQNISQLIQAIKSTFPNFIGAPATAASPGSPGQVAYDATHLYVCVANNTWVRTTLSTF